jgi:Na+/H+ antiporter NhaD/arsenite permease-like protein
MLLQVAPWSIAPFALLLLAIAVLPLAAPKWWHSNLHKGIVSIGLGVPAALYLLYLDFVEHQQGVHELEHALIEYVEFIVMLAALYTVAGGIAIQGQLRPTPAVNGGILLLGAVLANVIGTTGASMLLIRPYLRINLVRQHRWHLPVFFIFLVSNLGGLLTPLGDPPLFLGFLKGVDFFWTLSLWPHWLFANGCVLAIFLAWDSIVYRREPNKEAFPPRHGSIVVGGGINFLFLVGVLAAVLGQSPALLGDYRLVFPWPAIIMSAMAILSWLCTRRSVREHNEFNWEAIIEVAIVFVGIFVTMVPALALLRADRGALGIEKPWQYFWATGVMSSILDNAPTYVAFATAAPGETIAETAHAHPLILQAISAGAVFMGALTYIGNGPNFMVKSIAESAGYRMPSYFGYLLISTLVLGPVFVLVTWLFFL